MQVGSVEVPVSAEGLFPAVGMHSMGEEVKVDLQAEWFLEEDDSMMMVDSHEDDWGRLYDVRVSGTVRSRKIVIAFLAVKGILRHFGNVSVMFVVRSEQRQLFCAMSSLAYLKHCKYLEYVAVLLSP